ncbi:MAG: hypothetical protein IPN74_17510 [Haliscomenobacter sp.]|nr:hypothetical protein [Haliscomenobacter sp.]
MYDFFHRIEEAKLYPKFAHVTCNSSSLISMQVAFLRDGQKEHSLRHSLF